MVTPGKRSLRSILDKSTRGNKEDIAVCLTGHLNSENLKRLNPEPNHHVTWKTAVDPVQPLSQRLPPGMILANLNNNNNNHVIHHQAFDND